MPGALSSPQEGLKQMTPTEDTFANREARRAQQERLAQLLLRLVVSPEQAERQAALASYASSLARESGDEQLIARKSITPISLATVPAGGQSNSAPPAHVTARLERAAHMYVESRSRM